MKQLNFLSKSGSQSGSHRVVTLALTVGSPSVHRRGTMLRLCSVVAILLTIGVGNVWGAKHSMTPNQATTGSSSTVYITSLTSFRSESPTGSKIKWQMNQWNPKTLQVKTNQSSAASEFRFYTDSVLPGKITKVVVTFSALTVSDASKLMFKGGTSKQDGTSSGTAGTWNSATKTLTWTPGSSDNYTYFAFYQDGKAASGTNNLASSDAIVVTYLTKVTLDKNTGSADGVAYFDDNATGASTATGYTFSAASRTGSYTCTGYYTAASGGTKVLNANGTFANANVSGYITSSKWTYAGATLKLYAQWEAAAVETPTINPSVSELDWGTVNKGASLNTKTFTITGSNLTAANLVYSANGGYSVSPTGKDGAAGALASQTITVTPPSTATPGTYNSTVSISGGGLASPVSVAVKLTVQDVDYFIDEVQSTTGYTGDGMAKAGDYSASLPSIADKSVATTGNCQALHYHFCGWVTEANKANPHGHLATINGTATGTTYYAVWAKQGTGGTSYIKATSISEGVYVMVSEKTSSTYRYMPNTTSSGSNPALGTGITMSTTAGVTKLTNSVTDAMLWDFTLKSGSVYYIRPHGSTTIGLGTTNTTGTNIRISDSYKNMEWTIATSNDYGWQFKNNSSTNMYLAVYADDAWRNYSNSTTNQNGTFYLFKQTLSYADSISECCRELGSITGSVTVTQDSNGKLKATWPTQSTTDGWATNGIKIRFYDSNDNEVAYSTALANSTTTYTASDYTPGKCATYYATLTAIHGGSSTYCEGNVEGDKPAAQYHCTTSGYALALGEEDGEVYESATLMGIYEISDDLTTACAGSTITISQAAEDEYHFESWNVYKTGTPATKITPTPTATDGEYTFTMPAYDVTVSATFAANTSPTLDASGAALSGTTLPFGNQEINVASSNKTFTISGENLEEGVTVTLGGTDASMFTVSPTSGSTIAKATAESGQTITVSFTPTSAGNKTATLTFSSEGATDKVITLTGTGINLYTVTLNAGTGSVSAAGWTAGDGVWTKKQSSYQEQLTLPNATLSSTLTEAGWSFSGWKTTSAVTTQTDVKPSYVATSYTPTSDITLYAVYVKTTENDEEDEITLATTGVTGGSTDYTSWSNKTVTSDAKYAGQSAGGNNSIQIRAKNSNSGIISTASGGKLKKVEVDWNSNATDARYVTVSGNTSAYTSPTNLFDEEERGTDLGTIVVGTSTELDVTGNYTYVGIRASDAIYIDKITITWTTATYGYYSNPSDKVTLTYDANEATDGEAPAAVSNITIGSDQTVAAKPALLAKTGYSFDGWNTKDDGTGTNYVAGTGVITMNDNTTLYAKWTINKHKVSVSAVDNGTITVTPAGASAIVEGGNNAEVAYGTVVTLAQTNDTHYSFGSWSVTAGGNAVIVTNNQFTMPDADVTVSATFTENAYRMVKYYSNGGDPVSSEKVYVGEAPANAPTPVYEDCLEGSNRFYGWTTAEWVGAINASTLAGKTVYTGALLDVAAGSGDVNYYAVWAKATTTFQKGTSADLTNGQKVVIVNRATSKALETDGTWDGSDVTISTNQISNPASGIQWTIETTTGGYYLNNGSNQYLKGQNPSGGPYIALANTTTKWTLTNDGTYVLKDVNNRYLEYYNSAFTTFGSYNSNNANNYVMDFYVPVLGEFRTNCCALKPVTNVTVDGVTASSVTLTWTAPSSTTGITKLQIVNADNGNILTDNISASATSGTVSSGLTECESINLKVVSFGSECSSNSAVIAAIPQADAKTVTFNYNGGTGSPSSATTPCGETSVDLPSTPTRDGYRFMGWNDGSQTLAVNATTYTPAANVMLTAQWAQLYTITYNLNGGTLAPAPSHAPAIAGESVELVSGTPDKGFMATFTGWKVSYIDANEDEQIVSVSANAFTMPAANVTIAAQYNEIVGQWILLNDANDLAEDDYVVIAAASAGKAISTTQNTNNRAETSITKSGSTISTPSEYVEVFQLKQGYTDGTWAFKVRTATNYIYAASTSSNHLKTRNSIGNDGAADWTIATENGKTTVTANLTNGHNLLQYNSGSSMFSAYGNAQTEGDIALYVFREGTFYAVNMPSPAPVGGTLSTNKSMAKAGETVTLTFKPSRGYKVKTLSASSASGAIAISPALEVGVTSYTFTMPAEAVTVAASFEAVPPVDYNLVTDAADLVIGVQFLIVSNETNGYRAAATRNGEYLHAVSINDPATNKVSITTEDVVDFVLTDKDGDNWVISSIEGKLSQSSGNMSYNGANDKWGISISESNATISNSTYTLRYNYNSGTNPRFKTYANNTGEIPAIYALPYTSYNFELNDCKTIKIATGYTYTYTIKNTDVPSSTPSGYEFLNKWTDGTNTYAVGDAVEVSAATTLQPCWKVTPTEDVIDADGLPEGVQEIIVGNGKDLNINDDKTYENVTVKAGGKISGNNQLTVINNLTIQTNSGAFEVTGTSGQLTGSVMPVVSGELYIEIKLRDGDMDAEASRKWYCISAPFNVNMNGGFFWGDGTPMVLNTHFQLFEWDGDRRAGGSSGWKRVSGTMKAGVAYFIGFDDERSNQNTIKLKAMSNTISNKAKIEAPTHTGSADADTYGNWNGLANPNFHHIALNKNVQAFDYNKQGYSPYATGEYNFVVGTPFFIQYAGDIAISAANGSNPYRAPKRESDLYSYCVRIGSASETVADNQIYVRASETASAEYDSEREMITLNSTTSNYGALLWTVNYGGKRLAIEEAPLVNDKASYALSLYAPADGAYRIETPTVREDASLYLTYEGNIIWDLSAGAYELDLNKGATEGYGLMLVRKAPQVTTGVETIDNSQFTIHNCQKVILNDHVYILREGQLYDVTGKAVK